MNTRALLIGGCIFGTVTVIAVIDILKQQTTYQDRLAQCFFSAECCLSAIEYDRFIRQQERTILEGANEYHQQEGAEDARGL